MLEPIQGEGGINVAPPGYLRLARELCDKYGAMLVFDEIQCGMGRTGKMFYCEHDGVVPDLMALGKGFGGGVMPIGAGVGTPKTWEKYIDNPFLHTTTFGGNPSVVPRPLRRSMFSSRKNLPKQAARKGNTLLKHINALADKYPKVLKLCRGKGLMLGMEFADHDLGYEVAKELFSGKSLFQGRTSMRAFCRIEPPLVISYEMIDRFHTALEESIQAVSKAHKL